MILARARAQSQAAFARGYSGTLVLLVRVEDEVGDLRVGLDESTAEVPPSAPTHDRIGFSTTLDPEELHGASLRPPPSIDHLELRRRLLAAPHFALPIRKRESGTKPFAGKVSVGRARNNDIVLRHPTVSKFHAWFEIDEAGQVLVFDAKSKNHTWMAGVPLVPNEPTVVVPGVEMYIGRVLTLVVSPDALWKATVDDE